MLFSPQALDLKANMPGYNTGTRSDATQSGGKRLSGQIKDGRRVLDTSRSELTGNETSMSKCCGHGAVT